MTFPVRLRGAGGIGGLLARTDSGLGAAFYHSDTKGNITALVSTNGIVVARYQYDPNGNIVSMSGPLAEAKSYRFST
jgi:YD repeat-containing protein